MIWGHTPQYFTTRRTNRKNLAKTDVEQTNRPSRQQQLQFPLAFSHVNHRSFPISVSFLLISPFSVTTTSSVQVSSNKKMEEIASNLNLLEAKQRSVGEAHESFRAQADCMVMFGVKWKELEEHFDSVRNSVRAEFQELQELKNETRSRLADLEAKESGFELEMEAKRKELLGIVQKGKAQLHSLKLSVKEHCEKSEAEEIQLGKLQKSVKDKEQEYSNILVRCKEVNKDIASKENELKSVSVKVDLKNEEIRGKQALIEEYDRMTELKEQGLRFIEKLELDNTAVIRDKEIRLGELKKLVKDCELEYNKKQQRCKQVSKELESKEWQLNAVQIKVTEKWKEFDLKDEEIRAKQELIEKYDKQMKCYCSFEESLKGWERKLEKREMELKRWVEELEEKFHTKVEELNLIDKRVNDCLNDVQSKEKHLHSREKHVDSLEKSMQECVRGIEQKGKELELKQQQVDSIIKSALEHAREQKAKENTDILHSQVKIEQLDHSYHRTAVIPMPTATRDKTPASSIIGAPVILEKPESSLAVNATTVFSPTVQLTATRDAWNLQGHPNEHFSGNHLILTGFFQIAIRRLLSALSEDAFVDLLMTISQNKLALENFGSLGFGDKILDSVPKLIERKKVVEAVRVVCTFNLIDMYPPVRLLKEYVEDASKCSQRIYNKRKSLDEKDKVVDNLIVDLRSVIQCIKDYNLEFEYPSRKIEIRIIRLQKRKEYWRRCAACPASKVEQEQNKGQKRFAPNFQAQQRKIKCQLTAVPATTPYALPNLTLGYPQSSSSSYLVYENNGYPGQHNMATSDKDISKRQCYHCKELGHLKLKCPKYLKGKEEKVRYGEVSFA